MSKYNSWEIAYSILFKENKPVHYKKLSEMVIKTGLSDLGNKGVTPHLTLNRVMNSDHDELFKKVGRGIYDINSDTIQDHKNLIKKVLSDISIGSEFVDFAYDLQEPTKRVESTINRIIRDTKVTKELKKLYENRCQICSSSLKIREDKYYSEAHHIKPLGNDHKGPDTKNNILILCPNHHALLDYGAIKIEIEKLTLKHNLGNQFISYHNEKLYLSN